MLIACPNCTTSYRVEPSSLGTAGRSVRCVRCRSVWFATSPPEPTPGAEAEDADWTAPLSGGETSIPAVPDPIDAYQDDPLRADAAPAQADPAPDTETVWAPSSGAEPRFDEPRFDEPKFDEPKFDAPLIPEDRLAGEAPDAAFPKVRKSGATSVRDALKDIETFADRQVKRRKAQARRQWSVPVLPTAIMVLLVANIILIGWRSDVVKILPQTASLYAAIGLPVNLRGLSFSDVTSTTESHDGVPVLVVEGKITATSKRIVEVPRLRISLRNPSGQEVYAWTALPGRGVLSPGETLAFRSRLASPPAGGHDVIVRFFNRRDLVAGLQ